EDILTICEKNPYDLVRNKSVLGLGERLNKYEWILFIDNDIRPTNLTQMFLSEQDADVVACNYDTQNPTAAITPDAFHMGMVRVKASKIKELLELSKTDGQPLFLMPRNKENTQITGCECAFFAERLKQVDAKVVRIGHANHSKGALN